MPSIFESIQAAGQQPNVTPVQRVATPRTQEQIDGKLRQMGATSSLNFMPWVMNPNDLILDRTANRNLMNPAILQPGGVTQTIVGGKNIGGDLTGQGIDTSKIAPNPTVDDLIALIAKQSGKTTDEAKTFLQGLIASTAGGLGGPDSPQSVMARPTDPNATTQTQIYNN